MARARLSFSRTGTAEGFIVDFVCLKHHLVVEIDGGQHNFDSHAARDVSRDGALERSGFRVLRFWNSDVDRNLAGVLEAIEAALRKDEPHPTACGGHPPPCGEGMTRGTGD
jgi:very-short-patch-repair endonuclease